MNIIDVIKGEGIEMYDKGGYWAGKCPLHEDTSPSFVVYKNDDKYRCFGCGSKGDAIDFIRELKKWGFDRAVAYLGLKHKKSLTFVPYPARVIDIIALQEKSGVPVKKIYKELLIAMGWIKNG